MQSKVFIGIPVLREFDNIGQLLACLKLQTDTCFETVICVNQPEFFRDIPGWEKDYLDNQKTLDRLHAEKDLSVKVIDKSSIGCGWQGKEKGVGWARKLIFEEILKTAAPKDIIISLDADTMFSENYIRSVVCRFKEHPEAGGMAVPYYHKFDSDFLRHRMILYYEIYMRYYLLNLLWIKSPFAFTALGSAIAFTAETYKKIGGMTPLEAGEDFYLVQKICKKSNILLWNSECVYPSARVSSRVPFGTGQAVNKTIKEALVSYPFYQMDSFSKIEECYGHFPALFKEDIEIPAASFLRSQLKTEDLWGGLRKNFKGEKQFIKACHERFDGLKILQYLKSIQPENYSNEEELKRFLQKRYKVNIENFSFENCDTAFLSSVRNLLFEKEMEARKTHDELFKNQ